MDFRWENKVTEEQIEEILKKYHLYMIAEFKIRDSRIGDLYDKIQTLENKYYGHSHEIPLKIGTEPPK